MTICNFCMPQNMTTSIGNRYFSLYFNFNIVSLLNNLFIGFLITLKGKMLYFNKFEKQNVEF